MELQVVQIQKKQMSQRESHQHGRGMMRKDCRARHGGCRRRRRRRRCRRLRRRHRRRGHRQVDVNVPLTNPYLAEHCRLRLAVQRGRQFLCLY
jgi:hypothetical protein